MRDELPVRLGGLAANLARIKSFSEHIEHLDVVKNLLEESKFFIEWNIPDAKLEIQTELVQLQIQLALWEYKWETIWANPVQRDDITEQANDWSKRILKISGLL